MQERHKGIDLLKSNIHCIAFKGRVHIQDSWKYWDKCTTRAAGVMRQSSLIEFSGTAPISSSQLNIRLITGWLFNFSIKKKQPRHKRHKCQGFFSQTALQCSPAKPYSLLFTASAKYCILKEAKADLILTLTLVKAFATQHVASDVMFFGTSMVFLDLIGVG